jgi:hypothetical protein
MDDCYVDGGMMATNFKSGGVGFARDRRAERLADRRLTVLEPNGFDSVSPLLATKADLADMRVELQTDLREESQIIKGELSKSMVAIAITLFLGFGGMFIAMIALLRPA